MALADTVCCVLNNEELEIPKEILSNEQIFSSAFTEETWRNLDMQDKKHLMEFLPTFPSESSRQQYDTLLEIFGGSADFKFGNPVAVLYDKILGGHLFPDVIKQKKKCQKAKYTSYKIRRREYYKSLVQEILVSRQRILDKANRHGGGYVGPIRNAQPSQSVSLDEKVKRKYHRILRDIKQESQDSSNSSSDEEDANFTDKDIPFSFPSSYFGMHQPVMLSPQSRKSCILPFSGQPPCGGVVNRFPYPPPPVRMWESGGQGLGLVDEEYRTMLETHRKRRICSENHPELDTSDTTLADIIMRANPAKKVKGTKKVKDTGKNLTKQIKNKKRVRVKPKDHGPPKIKEEPPEFVKIKEETEDITPPPVVASAPEIPRPERKVDIQPSEEIQTKYSCFFALLRDVMKENPQGTYTVDQIRQKVNTWQLHSLGNQDDWVKIIPEWSESVHSALRYLAGEGKATIIQDFVPLTTLTETSKEWKWTGQGYDDEEILIPLCAHWLDTLNRGEDIDSFFDYNGDEGQPRRENAASNMVLEEQDFVEQEKKRYENPHKPYTYYSNGSLSVVGAVKGVFHKESGFSKAREHALLVSNRPAYVTILSLVKDAVARLTNGEGTRAEVCRLLKDSQFINPEASDAQIHTVVSGALDRLHAERDPCVKYDITRKLWIYLHRYRTEGEFERIHQASAAAALAKKQYAQRQKSVKQKKALQDLVDQQEKTTKDANVDSKTSDGPPPKKAAKRPKPNVHADNAQKVEKGRSSSAKDIVDKTPPLTPVKTPKTPPAAASSRKEVKASQGQKNESVHQRPTDKGSERVPMVSKTNLETIKLKKITALNPPSAHSKSQDVHLTTGVKLPLSVTKPISKPSTSESYSLESAIKKGKIKGEETVFSTVTLDAGISNAVGETKREKEQVIPSSIVNSFSATPVAIKPTVTPVNPVLNIVPPHCTSAKFVRLPFSHAAALSSGLATQATAKGQPVTKYGTVHLPNPSSSVLITVPQHPDRVAPLRISLPRASIGPNISVTRGLQSQTPVEFTRPGMILSRMATPIGGHQRIYVRHISHESLQVQPKPQLPVPTTSK